MKIWQIIILGIWALEYIVLFLMLTKDIIDTALDFYIKDWIEQRRIKRQYRKICRRKLKK